AVCALVFSRAVRDRIRARRATWRYLWVDHADRTLNLADDQFGCGHWSRSLQSVPLTNRSVDLKFILALAMTATIFLICFSRVSQQAPTQSLTLPDESHLLNLKQLTFGG